MGLFTDLVGRLRANLALPEDTANIADISIPVEPSVDLTANRSRAAVRAIESALSIFGLDQQAEPFGELTYSELRTVYLQSSSVRPCVDAIVRVVSSLPWIVMPKKGGDPTHAVSVRNFLLDPNSNKESLRNILAKVIVDLLVIDAGVIEKVKSGNGDLLEIYARDGATFTPIHDKHGILEKYIQRVSQHDNIDFKLDEIIYFQLYPRTWNFYGTPIIETIRREVASLIYSINSIGDAFTKDEIPPGILSMEGLGDVAKERLETKLSEEKGLSKKGLHIIRNVKNAKWIDLKRPFQEMQLAELSTMIDLIVRRAFGIVDANMTLSAKHIRAYTQTINYYMNREVIREFYDDIYFKLMPISFDKDETEAREAKSRFIKNLATANVLEVEELRRFVDDEILVPEEALD